MKAQRSIDTATTNIKFHDLQAKHWKLKEDYWRKILDDALGHSKKENNIGTVENNSPMTSDHWNPEGSNDTSSDARSTFASSTSPAADPATEPTLYPTSARQQKPLPQLVRRDGNPLEPGEGRYPAMAYDEEIHEPWPQDAVERVYELYPQKRKEAMAKANPLGGGFQPVYGNASEISDPNVSPTGKTPEEERLDREHKLLAKVEAERKRREQEELVRRQREEEERQKQSGNNIRLF